MTDLNRDIVGGHVEIRVGATGQTFNLAIRKADLENNAITAVFSLANPPAGRIDLSLSVLDAVGVRSNQIPFFVTIAPADVERVAVSDILAGDLRPEK